MPPTTDELLETEVDSELLLLGIEVLSELELLEILSDSLLEDEEIELFIGR